MFLKKARLITLVFILGLTFCGGNVSAQSYIEVYGQNRIQYREFDWKYFDTKHFRVYHYDKAGRQLGRYVAEEAENSISIVEKKLGGQFPQRFNIILYNSYDEYRQSNIGLKDESQVTGNVKAGTLNLVGDKLVVYFTGGHNDLRHQIRNGMAHVVMERMLFGDNFKKMVKNAVLMNLPEWVTEGYISFIVDGWDAKTNSEWKSLLDAQPKAVFFELSEQYPELAGKAFWKFISDQYGISMVKNLLYSMQQKTGVNKAMSDPANLGMKAIKAYDSCLKFYRKTYAVDSAKQEAPDSTGGLIALNVPKDNTTIRGIRVSPRGTDISYVAWHEGKYAVYTQKTAGGQQLAPILEGGQKDLTEQTDPDYPMLAWSTTGYKLAILYRKGFDTKLRIYNSLKGQIENYDIPRNRFDRVLSMAFMQDDEKLVFSAIKKSQTDLYLFTIKGSKMTNITDDVWDDLSPVSVSGGSRTGILFLSNRPKPDMNVPLAVNELPTGPMNVFFYNTRTQSAELLQCSDVKKGTVSQPIQYGFDNFAYLYDSNGINNKFVVLFTRNKQNKDSAFAVPITNYNSSIVNHQYNLASGNVADVVQVKDKYKVYFHPLQMPGDNTAIKTLVPTTLSVEHPEPLKQSLPMADTTSVAVTDTLVSQNGIKGGNTFQSEFADESPSRRKSKNKPNNIFNANSEGAKTDSFMLAEITDSAYVKMKPAPYKLSFKPGSFALRLDNSILFSQYQSIASNGGMWENPSLSGLITLDITEMMENYRLTAGFQLPLNVSASVYYLQYQNFKKRLDWGVLFLRSQDKKSGSWVKEDSGRILIIPDRAFKSVLNMVQADFSYPLDRVRSIRFHTALRQDKLVIKSNDIIGLDLVDPPPAYTSLDKLEYVFDNTISPMTNILNGTRFKFYGEVLQGIGKGAKGCYNFGFDIRNYQKVYKNVILASRLAYAHSDGNSQVEYLLGGVDNWIGAQRSANASMPPDDKYGFQAMCVPMRGYLQYGRIGNNYAVMNQEVRVPIMNTFLKRPIQSAILRNLQFVAFLDAGGAWKGFIPDANNMDATYSYPNINTIKPGQSQNVYLTFTIPGSGGLAMGYGAGLRTSVLGYFARMDCAWSIEGKPKPIIYFALGTDF